MTISELAEMHGKNLAWLKRQARNVLNVPRNKAYLTIDYNLKQHEIDEIEKEIARLNQMKRDNYRKKWKVETKVEPDTTAPKPGVKYTRLAEAALILGKTAKDLYYECENLAYDWCIINKCVYVDLKEATK